MKLPSVLLSLFRNRKQLYFLIGLISLVTISIILVSVLTIYISESELRAWENPLNYFSIAEPNINIIDKESKNTLNNLNNVDLTMKFMDSIISVPGILNTEYRPVIALDGNNMKEFMKRNELDLIEGDLPKSDTRELLISNNISKTKNLQVNDYVGNAINNEEFLWGRFKVIGIFEGKLDMALASLEYFERKVGAGSSLLVFPKANIENMNQKLLNINTQNFQFETKQTLIKNNAKKNESLLKLIYIIISILTVSLTIIVGLYISLYLKTRLKEFALYYSRGVSKQNIITFVLKELFLITFLSQLIGVITSYLIIVFLKKVIFDNLIFLAEISFFDILLILPLFLSIILVSLIISSKNLKTKKLEQIIMGD